MATAVMQVTVLPLSGAVITASGSNTRSVSVSGAFCGSKRMLRIGGRSCTGYGDNLKQGRRHISRRKLGVSKCSSEKAAYAVKDATNEDFEKEVQPDDIRVLASTLSRYNYISVIEVSPEADHLLAGARILLLDNPGCIHTVYYEHNALTNSYYDVLATIVPLLPDGPVGILGLGAGAVSHVLHHFFPTLEMHGWELDPDIITIARQFFNLSELEATGSGGSNRGDDSSYQAKSSSGFVDQVVEDESESRMGHLMVHIGDALSPEVGVEGGFAGLIVDLFAEGRVIPALQEPQIWQQLKAKLKPGGRIIVNCGGDRVVSDEQAKTSAGQLYMEETIAAMGEVFAGELATRYLARKGFNTVAVTGPSPDVEVWTQALPEALRDGVGEWKPVS